MKAVVVTSEGATELVEVSDVAPGPGEVRVRVRAAGVNPVDAFTAGGGPRTAGWVGADSELRLGWDFAGEVVEIGAGATLAVGAAVAGLAADSVIATFAEYVTVPESDVALVPDGVDIVGAGSLPLAALTAAQALELAGEPVGELLVTGAAGAVGGYVVALASSMGWVVTALARDFDRAFVTGVGAATATVAVSGDYDAVVDTAALGEEVADRVRDGGIYVGVIPGAQPAVERIRSIAVMAQPDGPRLAQVLRAAADGSLPIRVRATYPLDKYRAALADASAPGLRGKVVLTP